jgi:protein-S-isoprenylcysteine O-methyltransferase Ste14
MWAGIALRVWGVATLGRFFRRVVVVQEGHHVVTAGPYHWLRHPAYAGNLLSYLGLGVALGNWLSIGACVAIPVVAHLPRIQVEEATLTEALGEEYRAYARRTARLIPRIW